MGHIQEMSNKQRHAFLTDKYERLKEANRGHNFEYWNDEKHGKMISDGWALWDFGGDWRDATKSESIAKEKVSELRKSRHYARIICGYMKDRQSNKYFSIIYKAK